MSRRLPSQRTARGNRIGVTVVGAALVAAGVAALSAPGAAAVLPAGDRSIGAWWWAIGAGCAVVALACLRWLVVQLRRDAFGRFSLEPDVRRGSTELPARVLASAVEAELTGVAGVRAGSASFAGWPADPELRLTLELDDGADVAAAAAELAGGVVAHAREAIGVAHLPVHVAVELDAGRVERSAAVLPRR